MNTPNATPATGGDIKPIPVVVTPIKRDPETTVPTPAKGNDEVMSQPAKQS